MYGLIGVNLGYSYSKIIHQFFKLYSYELIQVEEMEFDYFMRIKNFTGINVTIPYKEKVIPYLDYIDEKVELIGACNTVINQNGILTGYNTDYDGFSYLLKKHKIQIQDKICLVLGTGGTSKTVACVLKDFGAKQILFASRSKKEGAILYDEIPKKMIANIVVNTTPLGTYPNMEEVAMNLECLSQVEYVVDVVYNPLRTKLMLDAKRLHIPSVGGLEMLLYQAKRAAELFSNTIISERVIEDIYFKLIHRIQNVVLIGLPGSGKSTIGKLLAKKMNYSFLDTDKMIINASEKSIASIFSEFGEPYFRQLEAKIMKKASLKRRTIISTGGGVIKNQQNIDLLKANGIVLFLDRDVSRIFLKKGKRPLVQNVEDLEKLKQERYELYLEAADMVIKNDYSVDQAVRTIKNKIVKKD